MSMPGLCDFAPLPLGDIVFAFKNSNFISGKLFVFLLFLVSIYAWTIMVTKYRELRRATEGAKRFLAAFRQERNPITLFLRRQAYPESPLFEVYRGGCVAISIELEARGSNSNELLQEFDARRHQLNPYQITSVRNAAERAIADQALELEARMGFLSTAASAAPLLGLLGTVWGVMDTFSSMAVNGAASISAVAPGISGALMTTGAALVVAIPAAIGYNVLSGMIRTLGIQMDNFADEYIEAIRRTFMSA